uniref:Ribosomal protein S19 binding protein 1 n=1 Tax=Ovis aries TaxID=9940 RepID=A0AC11E0D7_SHEEP
MSAALLRRGLELLGAPEAPGAAPGHTKPSQAPMKRTRKAKATQAQKLRNSAKGKVPKSALAEFRKRERRGYLGVNLRFMTSARSTVDESITRQYQGASTTTLPPLQLLLRLQVRSPWAQPQCRCQQRAV